jgi:mono/diheme cytochrome c family protein
MKILAWFLVFCTALAGAAAAFIASGIYEIGADRPHWEETEKVIAQLRDHAIERHAAGIDVPNLDDPAMIRRGARRYAEMCTTCHLTPGMRSTELREGLYPQPPDLARRGANDPAEAFWVIKHGLKMTAMPAWGRSHDDAAIWEMVAFLRQLPQLDEAGFEAMAGMAGNEGHGGGHHHDEGDEDSHHHEVMEPAAAAPGSVAAPASVGDADHHHHE